MASTPAWYSEAYYLNSKLAKLQAKGDNSFDNTLELKNAILAAGFETTYDHFVEYGTLERTSPNQYFNADQYLKAKANQMNAEEVDGRKDWTPNDVALAIDSAGMTLYGHFQQFGWEEGVNPSNSLDVAKYLAAKLAQVQESDPAYTLDDLTADLAAAGLDPISHYLAYGKAEGIAISPATNPVDDGGDAANIYRLKVGQDAITGSAGDDLFVANVAQNDMGGQVNTLGSGDYLDGGAGNDTLNAKLAPGVYFGGFFGGSDTEYTGMAIQPELHRIENINLESVYAGSLEHGDRTGTVVNARDIYDLKNITSDYSDADLLVTSATTLKSSGAVGSTSDIHVGMNHTGPASAHSNTLNYHESNFTVLFDQDYLVPGASSTDKTWYWLEDRKGTAIDPTKPLDRINVDGIRFSLDGVDKAVYIAADDMADFLANDKTWEGFVVELNKALVAAAAEDPSLANLVIELDYTNPRILGMDGTTLPRPAPAIVLVSTDGTPVEATGFHQYAEALGAYDVFGDFSDDEPVEHYLPVSINVDLDKVGRSGDGGALVIGSENTDGRNVWDAKATHNDTVSGIEEFNVVVHGGHDRSSSLSELASTNNNLRIVNVTSADGALPRGEGKGGYADLVIGNSNTAEFVEAGVPANTHGLGSLLGNANALKDVQLFNASAFQGNLSLYAALTDEVVAKYMTLVDEHPDGPTADNVGFVYSGGAGDDFINLAISSSNLAAAGTTTREDMSVEVNGGDGDDVLVLSIQDATGADGIILANGIVGGNPANWYLNSKLNANLSVNSGNGDDVIHVEGSGDWVINAGAGNDAIYVDDSGNHAQWVFNTTNQTGALAAARNINDLQSSANDGQDGIYKAQLTVTFKHDNLDGAGSTSTYTTSVAVEVTGKNTNDYRITDLDINQAIKKAINSDDVLSKFLVAEDGPANTLVVDALVDGVHAGTDLEINLVAPTAAQLTGADVSAYNAAMGTALADTVALNAAIVANINNYTANSFGNDYTGALTNNGVNDDAGTYSDGHIGDNIINGGAGDDVIVLGTGQYSNDTVVFNQGVSAGSEGNDTILNFVAGQYVAIAEVQTLTDSGAGAGILAGETVTLSIGGANYVFEAAANLADDQAILDAMATDAGFVAALAGGGYDLTQVGGPGNALTFTQKAGYESNIAQLTFTVDSVAGNFLANPGTTTDGSNSNNVDFLDFTGYANAKSVVWDSLSYNGIKGAAVAGEAFIHLEETGDAGAGLYNIYYETWDAGGLHPATHVGATLLGTVDFGVEQDFHVDNILV